MRKSMRAAAAALAMAAGLGVSGTAWAQPAPVQQACQRACLEGFVNKYLAAMAAHTVDPKLFAPEVRFTENGIRLPFGTEGLWATASGVGQYKLYVPDTETQNVAFLGTVLEQASSSATGPQRPPELVGLALRLRIVDGKITEVEQIAARPDRPLGPNAGNASSNPFPATGEAVEKMGAPAPIFLADIPAARRQSRADLVRIGNYYFDAVERNTGHDYYPFSDDCLRHENGIVTAGPPTPEFPQRKACKQQLQTSLIGAVTSIRDRRFVAIDRERGIAFAFAFFDHRPIDWTWQLGELFKIDGEQITQVEAIFIRGPYGVCSGWSTYEQCRSEQPRDER
ncbi:MAG: hypothetical protein J7496_03080 [Novosphingobium sp.]|nr:hypothetical protein [Novosphingobium sp.]MBO9601473.1 hypothetical protein [Novosphingobium sp.]